MGGGRIITNLIFLFFGIMMIFLFSFGLCTLMSIKPKTIVVSTLSVQSNHIYSIDLYENYKDLLEIYSNVLIEQGIVEAQTKILLSKKQIIESEYNLSPEGMSNIIDRWIEQENKRLITLNRRYRDAEFNLKEFENRIKDGIKPDGSYDESPLSDYYMNHNVLKIF